MHLLAARPRGRQHLVQGIGHQDQEGVGRRLLEGLQQGVLGGSLKTLGLTNDKHLRSTAVRSVADPLHDEFPDHAYTEIQGLLLSDGGVRVLSIELAVDQVQVRMRTRAN
jgi:hypothetical protein